MSDAGEASCLAQPATAREDASVRGRVAWLAEDAARRLAVALTPRSRRRNAALGSHLRALFASRGVDAAIDVGANRGQYYRFLRHQLGFRGSVLSIEPIPQLAAALADQAKFDRQWQVRQCALGASGGSATLNVMARPVFSSLRMPDHSASSQFAGKNVVARTVAVDVRRLDDIMSDAGIEGERLYLKLDTQGYDLEVLKGAAATLSRAVALQSEVSFVPLYHGMPTWQESIEFIASLGFSVSGLFTVSRDASMRLLEADCVFVRTP